MPSIVPLRRFRHWTPLAALAVLSSAVPTPVSAADEPPASAPATSGDAPPTGAPPAPPDAPPPEAPPSASRFLPIGAEWAKRRGVDLPLPFGVSALLITMSRDVEVTDVRVTLPGQAPVSLSDVATFAVRNETTVAAVKLDAWILPVLDVYLLAGGTWTGSSLDVAVTVDRPLLPPVVVESTQNTRINGPLLGFGATLVAGYGPWFALLDANWNYTKMDQLDGSIQAVFVSGRTGLSGTTGWGSWRGWIGVAYLGADTTLVATEESPTLGTVKIEVDQRPVNPTTLQVGGSVGLGKHWELLLELGSNFDDAFVGVFSASWRF